MSGRRITLRPLVASAIAIALLTVGAVLAYVMVRGSGPGRVERQSAPPQPAASPSPPAAESVSAAPSPRPDVTVTLGEEAVERAGIAVTPAASGAAATRIRVPAVVEPNAYRQIVVTPLVAGRVTRVPVELGARVRRGQTLAEVYSPELADAQTRFLSVEAELEAADARVRRTERLVEIGAASREELERVRAEHVAHAGELQLARSRLSLLGLSSAAIERLSPSASITATVAVPAPIDGVIIEREANVGLNVDPAAAMFTVTDLSTVWVVGSVYEEDFGRVRLGSRAFVTTPAHPDLPLDGRVSYVDPQLDSDTRTGRVRVELPNPRGELRLGMYADLEIEGRAAEGFASVPRSAVQRFGSRAVVYLADPKRRGTFFEREVRLGRASGETVEVLAGVRPGDLVVAEGSFFLRAERERLGLGGSSTAAQPPTGSGADAEARPRADVVVSESGFEPSEVRVEGGAPVQLTFLRTTDATCATEVTFPALGLSRELPLNTPVTVTLTPERNQTLEFTCGMSMFRGRVLVR